MRTISREKFASGRVPKRSLLVGGKRTSVSLDEEFWQAFKTIAAYRTQTPSELATEIWVSRGNPRNLSSAIRVYVLDHYQMRARVRERLG